MCAPSRRALQGLRELRGGREPVGRQLLERGKDGVLDRIGHALPCRWSDAGFSVITLAMIACAVLPVNGGSPESISYVTTPSAYTSLRAVIARSPIACSGDM